MRRDLTTRSIILEMRDRSYARRRTCATREYLRRRSSISRIVATTEPRRRRKTAVVAQLRQTLVNSVPDFLTRRPRLPI